MKVIIETNQFKRVVQQIAEIKKNRSLLASRKAGVAATDNTVEINPMRYSEYIREKIGIEMNDVDDWYVEDNSDPQL